MPRIRREKVPEALLRHLILRARERKITMHDLGELSDWLAEAPTVPGGKWFKRFATFTVCGEGELVKTFLLAGHLPDGEEARGNSDNHAGHSVPFQPSTSSRRANSWRLGKRGRTTGVVSFSGVNGTPLLRGVEFTHAPSQAGRRMAGVGMKGKSGNLNAHS